MRKRYWTLIGATGFALAVGMVAVPRSWRAQAQPNLDPELGVPKDEAEEMRRRAKRLGMDVPEMIANREKLEQQMQLAEAKQEPQLLINGDFLYVLDKGWLFLFEAETLELKNMEHLDMLRHQFMREREAEEHRLREEQRKKQGGAR